MFANGTLLAQVARPTASQTSGSGNPQYVVDDPCNYFGICAPPTSSASNLLSNADFESVINCGCPQPSIMPNLEYTKLCSWSDGNNRHSSVFNTCAATSLYYGSTITQYGAPNNTEGSQVPRSGNGYLGFVAYSGTATNGSGDRSYASTPLMEPLKARRYYYAEYYVSLAEAALNRVATLGFGATVGIVNPPPLGTSGLLTGVGNAVNDAGATATALADRSGWQLVHGYFMAGGGEDYFHIGCFDPSPTPTAVPGAVGNTFTPTPYNWAYYYADDVLLTIVPQAGEDLVTDCNTPVTLPVEGLALPASSGATYQWTANLAPFTPINTLTAMVNPSVNTTYTLTVTLPGPPPVQRIRTSVTVYVTCCYTKFYPGVVRLSGDYDGSTPVFAANTRYSVDDNDLVYFHDGTFTLPETSTLYLGDNASIFVQNQGTLEVDGGTITAACGTMWDGIYVGNEGNFLSHVGSNNKRRAEVSNGINGVVFATPSSTSFSIEGTNFLQNYESLTLSNDQRTGNVRNCLFDSAPLGMLPPYQYNSPNDFSFSLRHINCPYPNNNRTGTPNIEITDNILGAAMFGVWVANKAEAPLLLNNTFRDNFVAGIYCDGPQAGSVELSGNQFKFPTSAVHDVAPPQLNTAYGMAIGSNPAETYGLLENGAIVYVPDRNRFTNTRPLILGDIVPTYRQIGISATNATPSGGAISWSRNYFRNVYEGMRLQLKFYSSLTENTFWDCVNGIHLMGPGTGGPPNVFKVQCNTFLWVQGQLQSNNSPKAIFIDANCPVQLTGSFGGSSAATLLKNSFTNLAPFSIVSPTHVWNDPSNPPFTYDTYEYVRFGNVNPDYDQLVTQNVNVTSSLGPTFYPRSTNDCPNDGYNTAGIRARPASGKTTVAGNPAATTLESGSPNPAQSQVIVGYHLSPDDAQQTLALMVRSIISGNVVREVKLDARLTSVAVPVADLPEGVYVYCLLVNGRPAATQRLMVSR